MSEQIKGRHSKRYLFIDGYNTLNQMKGREELRRLDAARAELIERVAEYQAFTQEIVYLVFDAHQVKGTQSKVDRIHGIRVVYTKEHQTADSYIEIAVAGLAGDPRNMVRVVTGDWAEQQVVLGSGALRMTPKEFLFEMAHIQERIKRVTDKRHEAATIGDSISEEIYKKLMKP
ncbi:MAG: uncharacterized protein PWQ12_1279 [Clostridiales bacterium]|jgi:hypothetical protein|nr:uncharacterized protein [Clostridiales bacterium]